MTNSEEKNTKITTPAAPKKTKRRMKKQVRRTIGGLFMASAVVVAAIPTPDVQAMVDFSEKNKIIVSCDYPISGYDSAEKEYGSTVPFASDSSTTADEKVVYTSSDGLFQFVYMQPTRTDPNKVAVILGYTGSETSLTIPETLEGFRKYKDNESTSGYCLVSKNNEFLHYKTTAQKEIDNIKYYLVKDMPGTVDGKLEVKENDLNVDYREIDGKLQLVYIEKLTRHIVPTPYPDPTPDPVTGEIPPKPPTPDPYDEPYEVYHELEPEMIVTYMPCYSTAESQAIWRSYNEADLYYSSDKVNFYQCGQESIHQKINADVAYIGQEYLTDNGMGGWEIGGPITTHGSVIKDEDKGVFAFNASLTNLTLGSNIKGIGDYAFYGCSTLTSVTFSPKLETIGNGAFAECIRLSSCDIAPNANLLAIGKDAFYNCRSLTSFSTNIGLRAIGDSCFEGCNHLTNVYLSGENSQGGAGEVALQYIGNHVFKDCSALTSLTFPYSYGESSPLEFDMFSGCSSLQYVKISNSTIDFDVFHKDSATDYPRCTQDWEDILNTLPDSFYFEGPDQSKIHETCKNESIAFKYLDSDPELFEIKVFEQDKTDGPGEKTAELTYQIHTDGSIYKVTIDGNPVNVTIPETIGPYGIDTIGEGAFTDNCSLTKVTIPASCTTIGANAFKGCHNLESVTFTDATKVISIGENAFRTQDCMHSGSKSSMKCDKCGDYLDYPTAELVFCGSMINPETNQDTVPFQYAMNGMSSINNADQSVSWITYHSGWPTNMEVMYDFDSVTKEGIVKLIDYPRFEYYESVTAPTESITPEDYLAANPYLKSLPYVTNDNAKYYGDLISTAVTAYNDYLSGASPVPPTDNQMELINSALNIKIPSNVDAIKTGIFSGKDQEGNPITEYTPNTTIQTITMNGVQELEPYTFADCTALKEAAIIGPTYVGEYCFDNDTALERAVMGQNIQDTGNRPFSGCKKMTDVECLGDNYSYKDGLLFRTLDGEKELAECLESRGLYVGSYNINDSELSGVTKLKEEAFMNCVNVGKVDLSKATPDVIPKKCFYGATDVNSIIVGSGTSQIEDQAFQDTLNLRTISLPYSLVLIAQDAFSNNEKGSQQGTSSFNDTNHQLPLIYVSCVEGSVADKYAKSYVYMKPEYGEVKITHMVYFYDDFTDSKKLIDKQLVNDGEDANPPEAPDHTAEGYQFVRWTEYTNIVKDTDVYAKYEPIGDPYYSIDFIDYNGKKLCETQVVQAGKNATPPPDPTRDGHTFTGWEPKNYIGVYEDAVIVAQYKDNSGETSRHTVSFYSGYDNSLIGQVKVNDGESCLAPAAPSVSGYTFKRWVPSDLTNITSDMNVIAVYEKNQPKPTDSPTSKPGDPTPTPSNNNNNNNNNANVKTYTVSVSGGSGTGSYPAGAIVAINAYDMGTGQVFDKWTTSTAGVGFANPTSTSTSFTMPAANVAITATYRTGSKTPSSGGNGGGNSGSGHGGGYSAPSNNNGGTRVQVTKGGITNTGVAGASVTGSTDNFIVKVTDDQNATDLALTALQNKYGDITRLKYLPMDISLYDSTGRTKIADTQGISVNITLPLPDELAPYAGNNKVASTLGGVVEDLNSRFTTVDGVPCVSFTATHFSPYVIYVDTANLTESTIDYTPKTGDPIHPKWFLAIGLAAVSLILFFKKDKKVKVKPA